MSPRSLRRNPDGGLACDLDARGWGLFASTMDCREAARDLNAAVDGALADGTSLAHAAWPVMRRWASHGASDSEPFAALRGIYVEAGMTADDFERGIGRAMRGEPPEAAHSPGR